MVVMLPFALARLPEHIGWKPLASVIVLGVVATGLAQLLVNRLIGLHGTARTMLVNYLLPGFGPVVRRLRIGRHEPTLRALR